MKFMRITFLIGVMVLVIAGHALTSRADVPEGFKATGRYDVYVTTDDDGQKVVAETQCFEAIQGKDTYCETIQRPADRSVAQQ